ncbi:MAG: DsrE family protein [Phycisphaeraceae bacterium]|nr:DsrE family protein [Phycisphaeraceae bacterium]
MHAPRQPRLVAALAICASAVFFLGMLAGSREPAAHAQTRVEPASPTRLAIVWTSGDPDVAHRMALMYSHAAKRAGWYHEVTLIVWGPSQRLLVGDKDLQAKVEAMRKDGVVVRACIACANSYGIADNLRALGLPVEPMGQPLSEMLQSDGWDVLTF